MGERGFREGGWSPGGGGGGSLLKVSDVALVFHLFRLHFHFELPLHACI